MRLIVPFPGGSEPARRDRDTAPPRRAAAGDRRAVEVAVEVVGERARRRVAIGGILGQAHAGDRRQVGGHPGREPARRGGLGVEDLGEQAGEGRRGERRPAGQQLVQRRAEAVDIGAAIDRADVAARLLRRHVRGRAEQRARAGQAAVGGRLAGEAEVGDDRPPAAVVGALDEHVGRLDVAVDDAEAVGLVQRDREVAGDRGLVLDRHRRGGLRQRRAVDELEREVRAAGDLADLVDPTHVGVIDARLGARLLGEAERGGRIDAADQLERDPAAEPAVARPVHHAHAALAELALDLVAIPAGQAGRASRRGGLGRGLVAGEGRHAFELRRGHQGRTLPGPLPGMGDG